MTEETYTLADLQESLLAVVRHPGTPKGMTVRQLYALTWIGLGGCQPAVALAKQMHASGPVASRFVKSFCGLGYVKREVEATDRRNVNICTTDAGVSYVQQAVADRPDKVLDTLHAIIIDRDTPVDMTVSQLCALSMVALAGKIDAGEIGRELGMLMPAVSRFMDTFEGWGYLERQPANDARKVLAAITETGQNYITRFQNTLTQSPAPAATRDGPYIRRLVDRATL